MTYSSEVQELGRKVNEAFMHGTKEEYEAAVREFSKKAREELRNVEGAVLQRGVLRSIRRTKLGAAWV
jgi:hypothetical protein